MNYKLDTDTQVFFYEQEFYVFSNFSAFTLLWDGKRMDTSEVAYHYEKFSGASDIQRDLLNATSSHAAYKLAQEHRDRARKDWNAVKVYVMSDILQAKVDQHPYVKQKLLETGDRELIEDSWRDDFWGWGENEDGKNMLGKLWMQVRQGLQYNDYFDD